MFSFLFRVIGLILIAAGVVAFVVDGTKSIAASKFVLTPLGQTIFELSPTTLPLLQTGIQRNIHPLIWDPGVQWLLLVPTWAVAGVLGLLLYMAGRRRRRERKRYA